MLLPRYTDALALVGYNTRALNTAFSLAKRIAFNRQRSFSRFIIRLSVTATAVSVMAMILTLSFVNGFQRTISQKVFSFWGHIHVQHTEAEKSLVAEETPISRNDTVERILASQPLAGRVQVFATKSAVVARKGELEGILFKGVDEHYDSSLLSRFMTAGHWLRFSDTLYSHDIVISASLSKKLNLQVNDTLLIYFISAGGNSAYRKLKVAGVYKTGIEEYDNLFALGDIRLLRRVNNWAGDRIGGYEIFLTDYSRMDAVAAQLTEELPPEWSARSIHSIYPNIFDWLNIQDKNRTVVLIIMSVVAIINLITCLLILVLERTRMIGVLKAVGATDGLIRKIFLYQALFITAAGIGIGLIAGVGIGALQQATGFIRLDESSYYVSAAPVYMIWWQIALVCIGTAVVCFLALLVPSLIVNRIRVVKAIEFR